MGLSNANIRFSPDAPHQESGGALPAQDRTVEKLKSGDIVEISGKPFIFVTLARQFCEFKIPKSLEPAEQGRFLKLKETLEQIRPIIQRMSDRLQDPEDGATLRFAEKLNKRLADMPASSQIPLRNYLASIIKNGSLLHYPRLSVIAPTLTSQKLVAILRLNAADLLEDADYEPFMRRAYDTVPLATGGYFLFENPESEARFHKAVIDSHPELRDALDQIHQYTVRMTKGQKLTDAEVAEFDSLSNHYIEKQKLFMEARLEEASDHANVVGLSTRVRVSIDMEQVFTFKPEHYTQVFRAELDEIADILARAQLDLPHTAPDWSEMLKSWEAWARNPSNDPNWVESRTEWLKTSNPENLLDMNLCAEEIGSRIGKKGDFQFGLYQYAAIPEAMREMWSKAQTAAKEKGVSMLMLTVLMNGGHTFYTPAMGENLPNSTRLLDGKPVQRSMTFDNITHDGAFFANLTNIRRATGLDEAGVERFIARRIGVLQVAAHEYGHTFDHEEKPSFLTSYRVHVAEVDAESSALYLGSIYSPEDRADMAMHLGCWVPCRRAMQGLSSPHSQSDLLLFEKYYQAGGVEIARNSDGTSFVKVRDMEVMERTAFAMALQVRLWQRGVPLAVQERWLDGVVFDRTNPQQYDQILSDVDFELTRLRQTDSDTLARWKGQVNREVEATFTVAHMQEIKKILEPVLQGLDPANPMLIVPGDERLESLVEFN